MRYYPLFLDIKDRHCLVVGGGEVGSRKAETLIRCGAIVTVISRDFSETLERRISDHLFLVRKTYESSDLDGMFMIFAATSDRDLNRRIQEDAKARDMLFSVADDPECSRFIVPSFVERGDLVFAVSTGGKSPALSRKLRKDLESRFGPEYAVFLNILGAFRNRLLSGGHDPEAHRRLFRQVIDRDVPAMIKEGRTSEVKKTFEDIFNMDFDEVYDGGLTE